MNVDHAATVKRFLTEECKLPPQNNLEAEKRDLELKNIVNEAVYKWEKIDAQDRIDMMRLLVSDAENH